MSKKTIWITGGSTGIGKALAIKFASKTGERGRQKGKRRDRQAPMFVFVQYLLDLLKHQ